MTDTLTPLTTTTSTAVDERYELVVAGRDTPPIEGGYLITSNPANGALLAEVAQATGADVDVAVSLARDAMGEWRDTPWVDRSMALLRIADALDADADGWAMLDVLDAGMPLRGARRDVRNASTYLRYFAGLASQIQGTTTDTGRSSLNLSIREPYGVVARIVPFNHPLQFAAQAIAAPLAAGNAVLLKPSEHTPLSALHLGRLAAEHLPNGVLSVLPGAGEVGQALVQHPRIHRIGFTGSGRTGKAIVKAAADRLKVVSLELGGKNPMIVLPDADLDVAVQLAVTGMNLERTAGQSCGSTSRVYVPRAIADDFAGRLADSMMRLVVGDPADPDTQVGTLAFPGQRDRVVGFLERAVGEGARVRCGGRFGEGGNCAVWPVVLDQVAPTMEIAREEVFGPIVAVIAYDSVAEAVEQANDTEYGLTANLITRDLDAAISISQQLEAGYVWVNGSGGRPYGAPFGGYKQSGHGRENSIDELLGYTQVKNIALQAHGK